MRRLTWPPKSEDPERIAAQAWVLAWEALNVYGAGDNAQTRRLQQTQRAHEKSGLEEPVPGGADGATRWSLRPTGGDVLFEEAEWLLLKAAVEALRGRKDQQGNPVVTGLHVEPLLWLDDILANPPEVLKEDVAKPAS